MDRRRHLAAGAAHPAIGDECHPIAAILQYAQCRGQLVQLGHAIGPWALEADDDYDIAIQFALAEGFVD